jgi:hypothetical protein
METRTRKGFTCPPPDETTVLLRAKVLEALQPGMSPKAADFWNEILADHIRNRNRKNAGLDPIIARWDRKAPAMIVTIIEEQAA